MERDSRIEELERQAYIQDVLVECIYTLHVNRDMDEAMGALLPLIAQHYGADRAYIFQFDSKRRWMDNTYEWCREGVPSEKAEQQHMEISCVRQWFPWFEESDEFVLAYMQEEMRKKPEERRKRRRRKSEEAITAPFFYRGSLMGFLGVDNPSVNADTTFLLNSIARFVVHDLFDR